MIIEILARALCYLLRAFHKWWLRERYKIWTISYLGCNNWIIEIKVLNILGRSVRRILNKAAVPSVNLEKHKTVRNVSRKRSDRIKRKRNREVVENLLSENSVIQEN